MGNAGFALLAALTAALAALFLVLLGAVILRLCWRRRDAVASSTAPTRRGFVLFDVCFADDRERGAVRPPPSSMERSLARRAGPGEGAGAGAGREHGEAAADDDRQEPDEFEIERWKKIFGGANRSLSTIDEGTEKGGTTPITTPAFCTPRASPDRRDARALDVAAVAVQVHQA